jgi:addiction module RelE/StbE family toxin
MLYNVEYSPQANSDILEIYDFIVGQSRRAAIASKWIRIIKDAADNLSFSPQKYPPIAEWQGLRKRAVKKKYLIFYLIDERKKTVKIERVFDARRDWQRLLR